MCVCVLRARPHPRIDVRLGVNHNIISCFNEELLCACMCEGNTRTGDSVCDAEIIIVRRRQALADDKWLMCHPAIGESANERTDGRSESRVESRVCVWTRNICVELYAILSRMRVISMLLPFRRRGLMGVRCVDMCVCASVCVCIGCRACARVDGVCN